MADSVNAVVNEGTVVNAQVNQNANEVKDSNLVSESIVKVVAVYEYEGKVKLETNGKFKAINPETGEEIETNKLSFSKINLINQLRTKDDNISLADTLGIGQDIPTQLFGLILKNAELKVKRDFFAKGEVLEDFNLTAQNDGYKTTIISCKTNISAAYVPFINDYLRRLQLGEFKQPKLLTLEVPSFK